MHYILFIFFTSFHQFGFRSKRKKKRNFICPICCTNHWKLNFKWFYKCPFQIETIYFESMNNQMCWERQLVCRSPMVLWFESVRESKKKEKKWEPSTSKFLRFLVILLFNIRVQITYDWIFHKSTWNGYKRTSNWIFFFFSFSHRKIICFESCFRTYDLLNIKVPAWFTLPFWLSVMGIEKEKFKRENGKRFGWSDRRDPKLYTNSFD